MKRLSFFIISLLVLGACTRSPITLESLLHEMTDRESLAKFPNPAFTLRQFSSYDRATTGVRDSTWFANWDRSMFIRTEENNGRQEYVLFDAEGPGAVVRFWMTFAGENSGRGIMRIYFDGQPEAAVESSAFDIISGSVLTGFPLAASVSELSPYENRGHNLYLPLPYSKRCKITYQSDNIKDAGAKTGGEAVYYNINYRTYPQGTKVETFSLAGLSRIKQLLDQVNVELATFGRFPLKNLATQHKSGGKIAPGEHLSVKVNGNHAIRKIRLNVNPEMEAQLFRLTVIEMVFDGKQTVWAPIGDFFGTGYQIRPHDTWNTSVKKDGVLECFWTMPFRQAAELRIHNLGDIETPEITAEVSTVSWKWDKHSMYFGSSWQQYTNLETGEQKNNEGGGGCFDINYVTLNGKGVYAGDAISLFNTVYAWWGEGDEKIFVDGEDFPSQIGTGTEDYYGYAWCRPEKFINHPFISQPDGSGNFWPGYTVNIRQRCLDGIPFNSNLQMDMEMWHWTKATINFAPVTWWYMLPESDFDINADMDGITAPVALRRSDIIPPEVRNSVIEGENMELARISGGSFSIQHSTKWGWSDDMQLFWTGGKPGDTLEVVFNSPEEYNINLTARFTVAPDYGTVRLILNETEIPGTFNLNYPQVTTREIYLGRFQIPQGENKLRTIIVSPGTSDGKAFFGLDLLRFDN